MRRVWNIKVDGDAVAQRGIRGSGRLMLGCGGFIGGTWFNLIVVD